ncbi:MAG: hypothetical protein ACSLE9_07745 [Burkholderiaceae bacterium]
MNTIPHPEGPKPVKLTPAERRLRGITERMLDRVDAYLVQTHVLPLCDNFHECTVLGRDCAHTHCFAAACTAVYRLRNDLLAIARG